MEVSFPVDAFGCVRRVCPRCESGFGVPPQEGDGRALLKALVSRQGHANAGELPPSAALSCPFCAAVEPLEAFLTPQQKVHLDRLAEDYGMHVRHQQLSMVMCTLRYNPSPTFLPMAPAPLAPDMPPEVSGDERVQLACCGSPVVVQRGQRSLIRCPRCAGGPVDRSSARRQGV
jgi:hypothetical protein